MITVAHTSVPPWAVTPIVNRVDLTGRHFTILVVGDRGTVVARAWEAELASQARRAVKVILADDLTDALAILETELAGAVVGWRLMLAGPARECLVLRAAALGGGLMDEEILIGSTEIDDCNLFCAHCAATTSARAGIDDVVACGGCGRSLLVYHHVSRRTGSYLGFMVDAEEQ